MRAFAIHRLGLDDTSDPSSFPDARERGILIHDLLHEYGERYLAGLPAQRADTSALLQLVDKHVERLYQRYASTFVTAEKQRLLGLLQEFQSFESERFATTPGLQMLACEIQSELHIGGVRLRLRIDRVDALDEQWILIDYKTGRPQKPRLHDERLVEPQLPAYALAQPRAQAVALLHLAETPQLTGANATGARLPRFNSVRGDDDFDALRARWRGQLESLVDEYLNGVATVTPVSDACRNCHLQTVCRVGVNQAATEQ